MHIVLPLATPALAACGVIMFIISWHELLIPLILNARPDFMTLPVVIASLVGDVHVFFNLMMAICLLALLPTVVLVLAAAEIHRRGPRCRRREGLISVVRLLLSLVLALLALPCQAAPSPEQIIDAFFGPNPGPNCAASYTGDMKERYSDEPTFGQMLLPAPPLHGEPPGFVAGRCADL